MSFYETKSSSHQQREEREMSYGGTSSWERSNGEEALARSSNGYEIRNQSGTSRYIDSSSSTTKKGNMTLYNTVIEEKIIIEQVDTTGARLAKEARAALEARYKRVEASLRELNSWLESVERKLAAQERVAESMEELRKQTRIVKEIRTDIEHHAQEVFSLLEDIRYVCEAQENVQFLSAEELDNLEGEGRTVKTRYDTASEYSESLYISLIKASQELESYKKEMTSFKSWLDHSLRELEDGEKNATNLSADSLRNFVADVQSHQGDLRFISMTATKFLTESHEHLQTVNHLRANYGASLVRETTSLVKREVEEVSSKYQDLLSRANKLLAMVSALGDKRKDFQDALEKALDWLKGISTRVNSLLQEPLSQTTRGLEDQLRRAKGLESELLSGQRLIDDVLRTSAALIPHLPAAEAARVKETVDTLKNKYDGLVKAVRGRIGDFENALGSTKKLEEALASLADWLKGLEGRLSRIAKDPASLIRSRLEDQVREVQDFQRELESRRKDLEALGRMTDPSGANRIDAAFTLYEKLANGVLERGMFLQEVSSSLQSFLSNAAELDLWFQEMFTAMDNPDENVEALIKRREKKTRDFEAVVAAGKSLVNRKDTKDKEEVKERIRSLEEKWKTLAFKLEERLKNEREREGAISAYEKIRDQVLRWLANMEGRVENFSPVAEDLEVLRQQESELKVLIKEHREFSSVISKLEELGRSLEQVLSREEGTMVREEVTDIRKRYTRLGSALQDRSLQIDKMKGLLDKAWGNLKTLSQLLDKLSGSLPKDEVPTSKRDFDRISGALNNILTELKRNEGLLLETGRLISTSLQGSTQLEEAFASVEERWRALEDEAKARLGLLDKLKGFKDQHADLDNFLKGNDKILGAMGPVPADRAGAEAQLKQLHQIREDFKHKKPKLDGFNDEGDAILEIAPSKEVEDLLRDINERWNDILHRLDEREADLDLAQRELEEWQRKAAEVGANLASLEDELNRMKPVGRDLPILNAQTKEMEAFMRRLRDARLQVEDCARTSPKKGLADALQKQLGKIEGKAGKREKDIADALSALQAFYKLYRDADSKVDVLLAEVKEKSFDTLEQVQEFKQRKVPPVAVKVEEVNNRGRDLIRSAEKGVDTGIIQGDLDKLNDKLGKVNGLLKDQEDALRKDLEGWRAKIGDAAKALSDLEDALNQMKPPGRDVPTVEGQIRDMGQFNKRLADAKRAVQGLENAPKGMADPLVKQLARVEVRAEKRDRDLSDALKRLQAFYDLYRKTDGKIDDLLKDLEKPMELEEIKEFRQNRISPVGKMVDEVDGMGRDLIRSAEKGVDTKQIGKDLDKLHDKWARVEEKIAEQEKRARDALSRAGRLKDALKDWMDWLKKMENLLSQEGNVHGDVGTVKKLIDQHRKVDKELQGREGELEALLRRGEESLNTFPPEQRGKIRRDMDDLKAGFHSCKGKSEARGRKLQDALKDAEKMEKGVQSILDFLSDCEVKMRQPERFPEDEASTRKLIQEHEAFMRAFKAKEREKDEVLAFAKEILRKAHPEAVPIIKQWISLIESKWEKVSAWCIQRQERLEAHLNLLKNFEEMLDELMRWLQKCEDTLRQRETEALPDDYDELLRLIKEHRGFMEDMARRQPEVDGVCKPVKIARSRESTPTARGKSPGRDAMPHYGPRFGPGVEPQVKDGRVKKVWDKWKVVWQLAWDRQRRLEARLAEIEKARNFSWDNWKKRFLNYNQNKKNRVMDIFRGLDKHGDNLIPREIFIDAIMKTKFPTNRVEMNQVADKFDHGEGIIDYMEFIAALNPDWIDKKPDGDQINDEIARQVAKCTCKQKFRVFQVAEGKYRFGENQKLRLVRILRSTVMVRVGGGWESLEEFLLKNDPCRAQGRTNIELREQLLLPDGASQTMTAFHSRSAVDRAARRGVPLEGHVTKVRELSDRSVPMSRRSMDRSTPDSYSRRSYDRD